MILLIAKFQGGCIGLTTQGHSHPCASLLHLSGSLEPRSEEFKELHVVSLLVPSLEAH